MSGRFGRHPLFGRTFASIHLIVGSLIAIRFGSWLIDAIRSGGTLATKSFCAFFTIFGLIWGVSSIFIFTFNRKARLEVTETHISARYGWNQELDLPLDRVLDVWASGNALTIATENGNIHISGLLNAVEIGRFITERIDPVVWLQDVEASKKKVKRAKIGYIVSAVLLALCGIALIAGFLVLVKTTHGNALEALNSEEDRAFVVFFAAELVIFALACVFVWLLVKNKATAEFHGEVERACAAYENRRSQLERFPDLIGVLYYNNDKCRIVAYREENYRYMTQHFELKGGWIDYYGKPMEFDSLEELESDIRDAFSTVILTEE